MLFQAFIAFLVGLGADSDIGSNSKWLFGTLNAIIPLLFAFGFYKHYAGAYNAYLVFYILQLPKTLKGVVTNSVATYVFLAIYIAVLIYVWYVRKKLFPDFSFITAKKIKGQYVFS